jgi:hypothetical protein
MRRLLIPNDMAVIKSRLNAISEISLNLDFVDDFEPVYSKRKSVNEISAGDESSKDVLFIPRIELDKNVLQP